MRTNTSASAGLRAAAIEDIGNTKDATEVVQITAVTLTKTIAAIGGEKESVDGLRLIVEIRLLEGEAGALTHVENTIKVSIFVSLSLSAPVLISWNKNMICLSGKSSRSRRD